MVRKIKITINDIEYVVEYFGEDEEEIAIKIQADENALLEYLRTEDDRGCKAFCFSGLMVRKKSIETARFSEPDF